MLKAPLVKGGSRGDQGGIGSNQTRKSRKSLSFERAIEDFLFWIISKIVPMFNFLYLNLSMNWI